MTFKEMITGFYLQNGMSPEQVDQVFAILKTDESVYAMEDRWEDSVDGYPPIMNVLLLVAAKSAAIKWIDENEPQAWFRPCFLN